MLVRRDTFTWRGYVGCIAVFVVLAFVGIIIGNVGPYRQDRQEFSAYNCSTHGTPPSAPCPGGVRLALNSSSFHVDLKDLSPLNEEIVAISRIQNVYPLGVIQNINVCVNLQGLSDDGNEVLENISSSCHVHKVECQPGATWCRMQYLLHIQFLRYSWYHMDLSFHGPEEGQAFIGDVQTVFTYRSRGWTVQEVAYRVVLFVLSLGVLGWFLFVLRKFKWQELILEQKWTLVLLWLLLGLNNVLYPLQLVAVGWFFPFFNIVLEMLFLCMLLLYWLVMMDGVVHTTGEVRTIRKFYVPKIVVVAVMFVTVVILFSWQTLQELDDPVYHVASDAGGFVFFLVVFVVALIIYVFWLFYLVFRNISVAQRNPKVRRAFAFFVFTTIFTIVIIIVGFFYGIFGSALFNGTLVLTFFSLLSAYTWCQAFMYSPSHHAIPGQPPVEQDVEAPTRVDDGDDYEVDNKEVTVDLQAPAEQSD